jgi:hypothetical protein
LLNSFRIDFRLRRWNEHSWGWLILLFIDSHVFFAVELLLYAAKALRVVGL